MNLTTLEQTILEFLKVKEHHYYSADEIASQLNYKGSKMFKKVIKALAFFERVGEIEVGSNGKFRYYRPNNTVTGTYRANAQGFGFISYDENESDLFVPPGNALNAMHGDIVEAKIIKHVNPITGKGSEAQVVSIIERASAQLVGEFFAYNKEERASTGYLGYIVPQGDFSDKVKVMVEQGGIHPADHTICIVKITRYPDLEDPNVLFGKVAKEVGHKDAPGVDILSILFQFGIPHEFPENVKTQANNILQEISEEDFVGRHDLRDVMTITIDGADAKDLDDAISLEKLQDGTYTLSVHIADVSHYVTEGSALDREAFARGTSVYLTDRVVPMLPQRLSNGICSLHEHEDRLTITCEMTIDQFGKTLNHKIYLSVIHSNHRMTYDNVNKILDGDETLREKYADIVEMIQHMAELHAILEKMRRDRGALDFDAPEAKVIVDSQGHPLDIQLRKRGVAERLIESFMLAANETVAKTYTLREWPFIYRIHEQPDEERMRRFAEFMTTFGVILRGDVANIAPKQLQTALDRVKDEPYEAAVSTLMLRSMQQAKYSESPDGHYGLAASDYTHFTSPIRRYPDLIVHRLIHRYLGGKPTPKEMAQWDDKLPEIAVQSSKMERRAVEAERETTALKKAEYMVDKVGEQFQGQISSVTNFGMFVELPNTVEGLVSMQSISGDYFEFNQAHMVLYGKRTGRVFRIGQRVTIEVSNVNVAERKIDFILIDAEPVVDFDTSLLRSTSKKSQKSHARHHAKHDQYDTANQSRSKRHKQFKMKSKKVTKHRKRSSS